MVKVESKNDIDIVSFEEINKLNVLVAQQVKDAILKVTEKDNPKVLLDLAAIGYIDSTGFGVLLSVLRACKNNKGVFKICNISDDVMELVKLLQLQNVFQIYNSVEAGLEKF